MANIPNRRGRSPTSTLPAQLPHVLVDEGSGFLAELRLQESHHRHTLDPSYFPAGNEDKNHNTRFPQIPPTGGDFADRVYADPYRRNVYILNRNGQEMFFNEEEQGLISPARPRLNGRFLGAKKVSPKESLIAVIYYLPIDICSS